MSLRDLAMVLNRAPTSELPGERPERLPTEPMNENAANIHSYATEELALKIMAEFMAYRRLSASSSECAGHYCLRCLRPHLLKVTGAIKSGTPLTFVLPAFPGKSPNTNKVFGPLPDLAERLSLIFLNSLCTKIERLHPAGAKIIICSDGRVFSDVVGMRDEDVSAYHDALQNIIDELSLDNLSVYTLDHISAGQGFRQAREHLVRDYGKPIDEVRNKVRRGGSGSVDSGDIESHRVYCGMTRFLVEDALHPGQTKSKSAIQRECRHRAYEMITRSNAWSDLIAERFPNAIRLSIHPQACGSKKMGIQLLKSELWMTPWHGVAVETKGEITLMKRWEAEKHGAKLVLDRNGRSSHFRM